MQHHITIPKPVAGFILKRSHWLVAGVTIVTLFAVWQISHTPVSISALESFTSNTEAFRDYQARAELFGGDSDMLVFVATVEGDKLFTPPTLNAIREAASEIRQLVEVQQVTALTDVPLAMERRSSSVERAVLDGVRSQIVRGEVPPLIAAFSPKPWWPEGTENQSKIDLKKIKSLFQRDPLLSRRLISEDGNSQCMLVRLKADSMGLGEKWRIRERLTSVLQIHGLGREQIHISGLTISEGWILVELVDSLKYQLPLGIVIIGSIVFWTYRSLSIAGLTIIVGAVASVWAVAFTGLVFGKITILVAAVPLLIMVISTSDTIHIVSAYCKECTLGLPMETALHRVIRDVGGACVLTSLTTLVGFLSLLLIPVTAIRHLAVTAGVGVALALVLAITLIPIGIRQLKFSGSVSSIGTKGSSHRLVTLLLSACRWLSLKFPRCVVLVHFLLLAVAGYYALSLQFDPNLTQRFHANHPMPTSVDYFNRNFCGTNFVDIFIRGDSQSLLSTSNLNRIQKVQAGLLTLPEVRTVSSPIDLLSSFGKIVGFQTDSGLPPTPAAARASLDLLASIQPELVGTMVTSGADQMRITVTTSLSGFFEVLELSERVNQLVSQHMPRELRADVTGFMPVIARSVERIVDSQLSGLVFCFSVVLGIVMVALRSFRLGLISLLPNVFPLIILAGVLAFLSPSIDSDFIIIFTIAFGIAVDDTIHFLHRFDVELATSRSRREAVENAFHYSGYAIVQTTVVLGIGLAPLSMSNYLTIHMLGSYLVLTLLLALLADLLLLPALVFLFANEDREDAGGPRLDG